MIGIFLVVIVICLLVATSAAGDARHADSDHPFGSCTDKRHHHD